MQIGESFMGSGVNAAHVNTVLGAREGPVGTAWATALATPTAGHAPFLAVLQPGVPVKPFTLFVNKARIESETHARLTWGAAQAGIATGVAEAVAIDLVFNPDDVLIAAVWVDPGADDEDVVFANNREAVIAAIAMGQGNGPDEVVIADSRGDAWNPFFRPR
jgi:5,6,7,8-tetrahydromethanopterin hydro-lyase